jgi:hypothetical protein
MKKSELKKLQLKKSKLVALTNESKVAIKGGWVNVQSRWQNSCVYCYEK